MKKMIFMMAAVVLISVQAHSQVKLDKATKAATSAGFDVKTITSNVMKTLIPVLDLTGTQQPSTTDIISNFLTKKADILSLKATNPTSYNSKSSSLFNSMKSKLAGVISPGQLTKFMALKPKTNTPSNVLSNLFY